METTPLIFGELTVLVEHVPGYTVRGDGHTVPDDYVRPVIEHVWLGQVDIYPIIDELGGIEQLTDMLL
jgi:hypothetical protein